MWQRRARFELRLWLPSGCAPHFRRLSLNVIKQINLSEGFGVSVRRFAATATVPVRTLVWEPRTCQKHGHGCALVCEPPCPFPPSPSTLP